MGDGFLLHSILCHLFTAFAKSLESQRAKKTMMMVNRPTFPVIINSRTLWRRWTEATAWTQMLDRWLWSRTCHTTRLVASSNINWTRAMIRTRRTFWWSAIIIIIIVIISNIWIDIMIDYHYDSLILLSLKRQTPWSSVMKWRGTVRKMSSRYKLEEKRENTSGF